MAFNPLGSLLNRAFRNELNRMLEELYSSVFLFNDGTGFITSKHLADGSVIESKLADSSVGAIKLKEGSVITSRIGERAVTTSKIDEGAVTNSKIGNESIDHNKLSVDAITMNKRKDYPLASVQLGETQPTAISQLTRNAILEAKVYGAKLNRLYRISFIANGFTSNGKRRYGISVEERIKTTGEYIGVLFSYNDDNLEGNNQNANIKKGSDGIDTITVDNGEIAISVTIDRAEISASSSPEFLNLNSGTGVSPSAIIMPSNYVYTSYINDRSITTKKLATRSVDYNALLEDSLTMNRAKDFPLKSVALETTQPTAIAQLTRAAILDAKIFGAVLGRYYRVSFIANGHIANGKERYGITLEERDISTGERTRWIFTYNDDETPKNSQNANVQKLSDNIDTIIVDNGEIAASITVDRKVISDSTSPTFLNLNAGAGVSPTAIIDPSNYSF